MRIARTNLLVALAAVLLAGGGGCGSRFSRVDAEPGDLPEGETLPSPAEVVGGFAPTHVEVYPLSRLEGAGDNRRAVLHLRLQDAFSHDVKWPGLVRVALAPQREGGAGTDVTEAGGKDGAVFHIDLTRPEANAAAFDTISRCYVVRVPAGGSGEGAMAVRVRWLLVDASGQMQAMDASGILQPAK
ncbi:MAG: hypothetical protein QM783_18165 [Phycisphaerales bacterium]